uniref:Uncharacterized protein n=1 Tax=Arundo donax TaxID=35708 RepID=A0A0A9C3G1_ARUDO
MFLKAILQNPAYKAIASHLTLTIYCKTSFLPTYPF